MSAEQPSPSEEKRSPRLLNLWGSTVGKKVVMALTGVVGVGYLGAHVLGNLQAFAGVEKINAYAELLKSNGARRRSSRAQRFRTLPCSRKANPSANGAS